MPFGFFKNRVSSVNILDFSSLCNHSLQQAVVSAQYLKSHAPETRLVHFTSAYRSVGAAEMLSYEGGFSNALGIPIEWWVVGTSHEYNRVQHRVVKAIHGDCDGFVPFTESDFALMKQMQQKISIQLKDILKPTDVVITHEPYTLPILQEAANYCGCVIWRCHSGSENHDPISSAGWEFLRPLLQCSKALYCFTRRGYAPSYLAKNKVHELHPFIQPTSAKNIELTPVQTRSLYNKIFGKTQSFTYRFNDIHTSIVTQARFLGSPPPDPFKANILCTLGWWHRMKDHMGILKMFAQHHPRFPSDTTLFLIGPSIKSENETSEELHVWHDLVEYWRRLPSAVQQRALIINLPYESHLQNALMVNALQRCCTIFIQKSIKEGFGLAITEAMWKARAVIGTQVGGIQDQIIHEKTGLLLQNPNDLDMCASYIERLLSDETLRNRLGTHARDYVREHFLLPNAMSAYYKLLIDRLPKSKVEFAQPIK